MSVEDIPSIINDLKEVLPTRYSLWGSTDTFMVIQDTYSGHNYKVIVEEDND